MRTIVALLLLASLCSASIWDALQNMLQLEGYGGSDDDSTDSVSPRVGSGGSAESRQSSDGSAMDSPVLDTTLSDGHTSDADNPDGDDPDGDSDDPDDDNDDPDGSDPYENGEGSDSGDSEAPLHKRLRLAAYALAEDADVPITYNDVVMAALMGHSDALAHAMEDLENHGDARERLMQAVKQLAELLPAPLRSPDAALTVLESAGLLANDDRWRWTYLFARAAWDPQAFDFVLVAQLLVLLAARGTGLPVRPDTVVPAADALEVLSSFGIAPDAAGCGPAHGAISAVDMLTLVVGHDVWAHARALAADMSAGAAVTDDATFVHFHTDARLRAFGLAEARVGELLAGDAECITEGGAYDAQAASYALVTDLVVPI